METMTRVLDALGVRLVAEVVGSGKGDAVGGIAMDTLAAKPDVKKVVDAKVRLPGKQAIA